MKINLNIFNSIKNNISYNQSVLFYIKKEIIAIIKSIIYLTITFVSAVMSFLYISKFILYTNEFSIFIISIVSFTLFVIFISLLFMQQIFIIPKEDTYVNPFFKSIIKSIDIARYSSIFGTFIYAILKFLEAGDNFLKSLK